MGTQQLLLLPTDDFFLQTSASPTDKHSSISRHSSISKNSSISKHISSSQHSSSSRHSSSSSESTCGETWCCFEGRVGKGVVIVWYCGLDSPIPDSRTDGLLWL